MVAIMAAVRPKARGTRLDRPFSGCRRPSASRAASKGIVGGVQKYNASLAFWLGVRSRAADAMTGRKRWIKYIWGAQAASKSLLVGTVIVPTSKVESR
jgi:hypothetical protein